VSDFHPPNLFRFTKSIPVSANHVALDRRIAWPVYFLGFSNFKNSAILLAPIYKFIVCFIILTFRYWRNQSSCRCSCLFFQFWGSTSKFLLQFNIICFHHSNMKNRRRQDRKKGGGRIEKRAAEESTNRRRQWNRKIDGGRYEQFANERWLQ